MEVLLATLLFIILSPGLIFTLPPGKGGVLAGGSTSNIAVLVHACLFFVAQKLANTHQWPFDYLNDAIGELRGGKLASETSGINSYAKDIAPLVATFIFIILSPGLLLTLPPDEGSVFMSQDTNALAVLLHGVIYFVGLKYWADNLGWARKDDGSFVIDPSGAYVPKNTIITFLNDQFNSI